MNLHKKVGQMMIFGFKGIQPSEEIKFMIREYHIGGVILFGRNIGTPQEILHLTSELQEEARRSGYERPLLICIDQENGAVRRLGEGATIMPGSMLLGATQQPELAYETGKITGKELRALGINWNLAPVVDVNNNPLNPVIGVRSFGEDPKKVAEFSKEAVRGMQDAGVMTTIKHFPGHGDTQVDSHLDLPVIDHDMDRLQQVELVPFKECINHGADTVMSAHVYFPTIEPELNRPATLSKRVITGLLREELGFEGVVTTDCMEMDAISKGIGTPKGGVEAVKAGIDLVMVSHLHDRQEETIKQIVKAVKEDDISMEHIEDSIRRINKLKDRYLSWAEIASNKEVPSFVGSDEHQKVSMDIYQQGVTLAQGQLPLPLNKDDRVLVVYPKNEYAALVEDKRYSTMTLGKHFKSIHEKTDVLELQNPIGDNQIKGLIEKTKEYDYIILGTLNASLDHPQQGLLKELAKMDVPVVAIAIRSPYDVRLLDFAQATICTYEFSQPALQLAVEAIVGSKVIRGNLPVTIN
ncbi:beta-N-acetylhexosaminidase [Piscibacillus halophilus]|uniref:Beta-N-acetylhexosaminidase n=1 Tax=Piscibacillus halophilus TaxID=571933 RepID=A0A1H9I248_9BACI|nr:beta-N-acetylhexosaminidase [Piscibacillus halophilus]SEQ68669.1 beta-N-acetylhexosaminidase [Piscibacillus halophilus]